MQLSLIDPRLHPIATQAMLDDVALRGAIRWMRRAMPTPPADAVWPFVEDLGQVAGGRTAWAVDDCGLRYVVVGAIVFRPEDFDIMHETLRQAAVECFGRLDACGRAA